MNKIKEKILLAMVKRGNAKAFSEVYDCYIKKIYRFIYFKVSNVEEAEDLTSEVFTKILEYLNSGEGIKNLEAFLFKSARNVVIDFYRRRNFNLPLNGQEILDKNNLEEKIKLDSDLEEIKKALKNINEEYKEVIVLYYLEDLPTKEISQILEKSENYIRVLLHRGLKALRENLKTEKLKN